MHQVLLLNVFTSTNTDTDTWKHCRMCSQSNFLYYFSLTTLEKAILWIIMHKQQNWFFYNILDRFRYHQNAGIGLIPIQIPGIGAAALVQIFEGHNFYCFCR